VNSERLERRGEIEGKRRSRTFRYWTAGFQTRPLYSYGIIPRLTSLKYLRVDQVKIILISIGTRGDMEPFLAIGEILQAKGHQVVCAFPEQFRDLAAESNLEFDTLGRGYIDLLESDLGKAAMGTGGSALNIAISNLKLAGAQNEINKELVLKQYEIIESQNPDRIVYNSKATYPIIWGLENRGKNILICALPYMHYARDHTHVAFNGDYGPLINKFTYSVADFGSIMTVKISARWLKLTQKITRRQLQNALSTNKAIYTISPSLFSRQGDWGENLRILGYHARSRRTNWQPDSALTDFLEAHKDERIVLITFGSMTNLKPMEKTKIFVEILERNKIPAIINTASGGLVEPVGYDSGLIHFVPQIPYDWIFPKVYGVIHHGGSGTTHLALKYGCATLIIPHIIDQFVWRDIVYEKGAGPEGVKLSKLTMKNIEPKILDMVNNNSYKTRAEQLASQMAEEEFREEIYRSIVGN
jgi:sterol 3beta-glucosyltransferase